MVVAYMALGALAGCCVSWILRSRRDRAASFDPLFEMMAGTISSVVV